MKKVSVYFACAANFLAVSWLGLNQISGQSPNVGYPKPYYTIPADIHSVPPVSSNHQMVAYRIAAVYQADPLVIESFVKAAVYLENDIGIAAPVVLAIAIHESTFNSHLYSNSGNPFGIKASSPWEGSTFAFMHDGEITAFRKYNSAEEALLDFGNFVRSRTWYADALSCPMNDYACVIDGLKKTDTEPGYSLNPQWDEAVLAIIEKIHLESLALADR